MTTMDDSLASGMSTGKPWRYILHADLDAFYASIEQRDNPALRGKPVAVGGAPETRGVVAAASYEARTFGVFSAMPMSAALRACPQLIRVPPRFGRYREVSRQIMEIFHALTPLVEPLSLDEAYMDVSEQTAPDTVESVARSLKAQVREATQLTVTIGGGASKTVAKIASKKAKPDGLLMVRPGDEVAFLAPLDVDKLWGVGPKTASVLHEAGLATIGALAQADDQWLRRTFGVRGLELKRNARGEDDAPVVSERDTKSVSVESTFATDIGDQAALLRHVDEMARDVAGRLQRHDLKGKTVRVKLRLADFTTFTRQDTVAMPTNDPDVVSKKALEMARREMTPGRKFRLVGVGVSNFGEADSAQLPLLPPD